MTITGTEERALMVPVNGVGLRILVVEDNADCALSMAMVLRMYGHDVEIATNGPTALEKARKDKPDAVLLDLGLPGMSGYDVAGQLSVRGPGKTPLLIAVTGYGMTEDRQHSAAAGIDLHLVKPVDLENLRAVLTRFQQSLAINNCNTEGNSRICGLQPEQQPHDGQHDNGTRPEHGHGQRIPHPRDEQQADVSRCRKPTPANGMGST